jgi:hypothetical protein
MWLLLCFCAQVRMMTPFQVPLQSQSHIATDGQSVSLGIEPHLGPMIRYLFLSDSYVLVMGHPL